MNNILIGIFDELDDATRARAALLEAGYSESHISIRSKDSASNPTRGNPAIVDNRTAQMSEVRDTRSSGVSGWLLSLFGDDDDTDEDAGVYAEAIDRGVYLLTVDEVPDRLVDEATDIIEQHGALDIDERAQRWRGEGWTPPVRHRGAPLPGVAGRPPSAGRAGGLRTDVDQDFGAGRPEQDERYRLDERGYPPLHNADPEDVARLVARDTARRAKVRVYMRPRTGADPRGVG
jgi:hypothetical protein